MNRGKKKKKRSVVKKMSYLNPFYVRFAYMYSDIIHLWPPCIIDETALFIYKSQFSILLLSFFFPLPYGPTHHYQSYQRTNKNTCGNSRAHAICVVCNILVLRITRIFFFILNYKVRKVKKNIKIAYEQNQWYFIVSVDLKIVLSNAKSVFNQKCICKRGWCDFSNTLLFEFYIEHNRKRQVTSWLILCSI